MLGSLTSEEVVEKGILYRLVRTGNVSRKYPSYWFRTSIYILLLH